MSEKSAAHPLVTIVLPTYNGHAYLREAIRSCLDQTWRELELVIVDDGSTHPETRRILDEQVDSRVRIVRQKPNSGLPAALNRGFAESRGEMLSWTSDDNLYRPEAIETMAGALMDSDAEFVYAPCNVIDEKGQNVGQIVPRPPDFLPIDNGIGACFLYTRRVYETVGDYDTGSVLTEDYDYWIRISKHFPMLQLDETLYDYRTHGETLTAREGRGRVKEMIDQTRRRHFSPSEIRAAEALRVWRRSADLRAAGLLLKALVRRPGDMRLYKPLVLSLLPDIVVRCAVKCREGIQRD